MGWVSLGRGVLVGMRICTACCVCKACGGVSRGGMCVCVQTVLGERPTTHQHPCTMFMNAYMLLHHKYIQVLQTITNTTKTTHHQY